MRWLIVTGLLVTVLVGCGNSGATGGCSKHDRETVTGLAERGAWQQFKDAVHLAQNASRIALTQPIADLQRIRRDFSAEAWPTCAATAKQAILDGMDATIAGFLAFMGGDADATVQMHFADARSAFERATAELVSLRPTPTP